MINIYNDKIFIFDFGVQYMQLIVCCICELGVYCEIWVWDYNLVEIVVFGVKGIILFGGLELIMLLGVLVVLQEVFDSGLLIFGICYGMQILVVQLGGVIEVVDQCEFGYVEVNVINLDVLFKGLSDYGGELKLNVWMSYGDYVFVVLLGFIIIVIIDCILVVVMVNEEKCWYGVQFYLEVIYILQGQVLLCCFVVDVCGCQILWIVVNIIDDQIVCVCEQVGDDEVILGLFGGVDLFVVVVLLYKVIGEKLICVFVDIGLLCWQEGDQVMVMFVEYMGVKVVCVNVVDCYFVVLEGVSDLEVKCKIIGNLFVEIFDEELNKLKNVKWLVQGIIYLDVIELVGSKIGKVYVIKSYYNVGGLLEYMKLGLVELLCELFKDEVCCLGVELGLLCIMVYCYLFLGLGLGVCILGEVKCEYVELLVKVDVIFIDELCKVDLYDKISQVFVVFLLVKLVGVVGDVCVYEWVIVLWVVEMIDFMMVYWVYLLYEFLGMVSNWIINELWGVLRVVYDILGKLLVIIEWE